MAKLTVKGIRALAKAGRYGDGGTLYLVVAPGGSKSWVQRLSIHGKVFDMGLGGFPMVTLAEARIKAFENRRIARNGGDPRKANRKLPTFEAAARKVYQGLLPTWKNPNHGQQWIRTLEVYAFPAFGDLPIDRVGREDVLRALTPIWQDKAETARRVRQRIRAVFAAAQAEGHRQDNPAGEVIDAALPKNGRRKSHFRALPHGEVAEALRTIEASGASIAARGMVRFAVLTAARSGEVRGATWAEIDFEARTWTIPAERMKAGREHRVPLSAAAVEVLEAVKVIQDGSGLIFPSPARKGRQLSGMAGTKLLRDTGLAARTTLHGFRSSFRDWCAESGKPREVAEAALAHVVGGVEGAYFRSDLFQRRAAVMESWAQHATGQTGEVVQLRRA